MAHGCERSTYDHEDNWLVTVPAAPAAMEDVKDERTVRTCMHSMMKKSPSVRQYLMGKSSLSMRPFPWCKSNHSPRPNCHCLPDGAWVTTRDSKCQLGDSPAESCPTVRCVSSPSSWSSTVKVSQLPLYKASSTCAIWKKQ